MFNLSAVETLCIIVVEDTFGLSKERSIQIVGSGMMCVGIVTSIGFAIMMKVVTHRFSDRVLLLVGAIVYMLTSFVMIPWGNKYVPYQPLANSTGCRYDWCESVPAIQPFQIVLHFTFYSLAFVLLQVSSMSLYSKVLGSSRQGLAMSVNVCLGALGRLTGPLAMIHMYTSYGPRIAYSFQLSLGFLFVLSLCIFYKRLVSNIEFTKRISQE